MNSKTHFPYAFIVLCTGQIEASTFPPPPPGNPPACKLLKIGLFKFPPLGGKSRSNAPPVSTEIPLLKDKFRLQSNTVHAPQREMP